jgi:tetratricopeptide (TPR) repeat protein
MTSRRRWPRRLIRKGIPLFVIVIACAVSPFSLEGSPGISYDSLPEFEYLNRMMENFLRDSYRIETIRRQLESRRVDYLMIEDPRVRYYLLGRLQLILGNLDEAERNPSRAVMHFEESLASAERAVAAGPFSDGYRLAADAYSHIMRYKGITYRLAHGLKIKEYARKALAMDENNDKAKLSLALYHLNAPAIAGGDRSESVRLLTSVLRSGESHPLDRYGACIWLAIVSRRMGDHGSAGTYLDRAFELYPRNSWIDDLLEEYWLEQVPGL